MDGPQPINHRHADFQSSVRRLLALYSNKLAGARCAICTTVHNNAQLIHANLTHRIHRVY